LIAVGGKDRMDGQRSLSSSHCKLYTMPLWALLFMSWHRVQFFYK